MWFIQVTWLLPPCPLGGEQALLGVAFAAQFVARWTTSDPHGDSIPHGGELARPALWCPLTVFD